MKYTLTSFLPFVVMLGFHVSGLHSSVPGCHHAACEYAAADAVAFTAAVAVPCNT
jgi:hypothetical protein